MAIDDTEVAVNVKYGESGGDVLGRARRGLQDLDPAAHRLSETLTDRLGQAFNRLEAREPTMAMRRVRGAIDELSASALGATGPLGKMASSFIGLIPGGVLTLGVVGGLSAIGLEMKKLIGAAGELETAMIKANDAIAGLGGSGGARWAQIRQKRQEIEDLSKPNFWEGFFFKGLPNWMFGDITDPMRTGREARIGTAQTGLSLLLSQSAGERTRRTEEKADQDRRDAEAARREQERADREWLKENNRQTENRLSTIQHLAAPRLAFEPMPRPRLRLPRGGIQPAKLDDEWVNRLYEASLDTGPPSQLDIPSVIGAGVGLLGAAREGGAAGLIAGAGGVASALPGGQMVGAVLQGFAGLTRLFGGGQAKVTIDDFSAAAIEKMRQVQQIPQNVSTNIVGPGNIRQTSYALARNAARGGVTTLPYG